MSTNNTTNFNMKLTDTEKEIMDFVTEVIHSGRYSKADLVVELFKQNALHYLGLPDDAIAGDDKFLLSLLKEHKRDEDITMIKMIGIDKYKALIENYKKEYGEDSSKYLEECLVEYERRQIGGNN